MPRLLLAWACALFPFIAAAQNPGTNVSFRVLCFDHNKGMTKVYVPLAGGKEGKTEVPLYTNDFSDLIDTTFPGDKAFFFTEEDGPAGKPVRRVVAEAPLLKVARQAIVLLPAPAGDPMTYRALCFDDSGDSFPMGGTRVINLSPFPIRLNLAGADLPPIKPEGAQLYPQVKAVDEWNMYNARVDFFVKEAWVAVANQSWKAVDRKRDWVITSMDPNSRQPVIRLYQDIPPWKKPNLTAPSPAAAPTAPSKP
ncbi:hypothetical protein llg_04480 [Luteolibacter sp. LG18]|nr:hypothetical protein llg_04480 [Luteolibacter sp. LG18]